MIETRWSNPDHRAAVAMLDGYESEVVRIFPNREPWAGGTPCVHRLLVGSRLVDEPFEQIKNQRFDSLSHACDSILSLRSKIVAGCVLAGRELHNFAPQRAHRFKGSAQVRGVPTWTREHARQARVEIRRPRCKLTNQTVRVFIADEVLFVQGE